MLDEKEFKELVGDKITLATSDLLRHSMEGFIDKMTDTDLLRLATNVMDSAHNNAKRDLILWINEREKGEKVKSK